MGEEGGDGIAGSDELNGTVGDLCRLESAGDDGGDCDKGLCRLLAALEDGCVAGLDGEGGDVCDDLRAGLEDNEEDANRGGDTLEDEVVVELGLHLKLAD